MTCGTYQKIYCSVNPDSTLTVTMLYTNFTGSCSVPYTVSDFDLDNPLTANATSLIVALVTNPPVAVNDYVYVKQASGTAIIPISTIMANDYTVDIGSILEFVQINTCNPPTTCKQVPTISGSNILWPNSNPTSCDGDAFDYRIKTQGTTLFANARVTIVITNCVCTNVAIDLMFLADGSGSIQPTDWTTLKAFMLNVTKFFTIGPGNTETRVGVVQFSGSIRHHVNISKPEATIRSQVEANITNMVQLDSSTATLAGLQSAMTEIQKLDSIPSRKSVAKVIVLITDGSPNVPCNCACCICNTVVKPSCSLQTCGGNTSRSVCDFDQVNGEFCLPCADPTPYTTYINNLKISNNNSFANYKVVALGIGAGLTAYSNAGWNIVKSTNYNPDLAIQVAWANINQAIQAIVDAACSN
jgi:hypothetical protein